MKHEAPGGGPGAARCKAQSNDDISSIAQPAPPDNQPAGDLDRALAGLPIAIARLRALAIMVGIVIGAALGLAGCWWVHLP